MTRWCVAALAAATATLAHAGRPLTTDDASIIEEKRCQVEAWVDRARDAWAAWAAPACNFGGGIEWQAGFARAREEDSGSRFAEAYVQSKWLIPIPGERWAMGMSVSIARHATSEGERGWVSPQANLAFSGQFGDTTVHFAPGYIYRHAQHRHAATWGIAAEHAATPVLTVLAEAFGENRGRPFYRAGGRWTAIADVLDFDLSYVARPGGTRAERFVSLGVFWQSSRFLP